MVTELVVSSLCVVCGVRARAHVSVCVVLLSFQGVLFQSVFI